VLYSTAVWNETWFCNKMFFLGGGEALRVCSYIYIYIYTIPSLHVWPVSCCIKSRPCSPAQNLNCICISRFAHVTCSQMVLHITSHPLFSLLVITTYPKMLIMFPLDGHAVAQAVSSRLSATTPVRVRSPLKKMYDLLWLK
jgi:hypothetical protein